MNIPKKINFRGSDVPLKSLLAVASKDNDRAVGVVARKNWVVPDRKRAKSIFGSNLVWKLDV